MPEPLTVRCRECGYEVEYETENIARREGWWVAPEEGDDLCNDHSLKCCGCGTPMDPDDEFITWIHGDPYCTVCARSRQVLCSVCEHPETLSSAISIVNRDTHEQEYRCREHMPDPQDTSEGYGIRSVLTEVKLMNSNGHILQFELDPKFKRNCPICQDDFEPCAECAKRIAENKLKEETNLWVYDTRAKQYHDGDHDKFKRLKYREEHEHPFLYYGMELELLFLSPTNIDNITRDFIKATNGLFVAEYDRSVSNLGNGIEFISRPMSYKKWTSDEVYQLLKAGFSAIEQYKPMNPQPDGCGIHIHMSRIFFDRNTDKDVQQIRSDLDWIFQVYQEEIEKLSERSYTQYCASKAYKIKNQLNGSPATRMLTGKLNLTREIQCRESALNNSDHHDCITMTNRTIEIRTFKSTTDIKKIIAIIEVCRALAHSARNIELTEETKLSDILFAKDCKYLPDIVHKLKIDTSKKFDNILEVEL